MRSTHLQTFMLGRDSQMFPKEWQAWRVERPLASQMCLAESYVFLWFTGDPYMKSGCSVHLCASNRTLPERGLRCRFRWPELFDRRLSAANHFDAL